jgi:hypothetical protein
MRRKPFRPAFLPFLAPSPHVQALAVLRWADCRDYLDSMLHSTLTEVESACRRDAEDWCADYATCADSPVRITRAGIAEVARIMLADCVAMAAEWQGPPEWMAASDHAAAVAALRRCDAGFRSPSIRQPW